MKTGECGDPESIKILKCICLFKRVHNNGALNLSLVVMYLIAVSISSSFSLLMNWLDPKRNVWVISYFFDLSILRTGDESELLF